MNKKKDWDILSDFEDEISSNIMEISSKNRIKKRIPIYLRIIISAFIYCIIYTILNVTFSDLANYINQITCFVLAILGFIFTSYKDYKNKLYNEIYGKDN